MTWPVPPMWKALSYGTAMLPDAKGPLELMMGDEQSRQHDNCGDYFCAFNTHGRRFE
jgi:hypothetical protein